MKKIRKDDWLLLFYIFLIVPFFKPADYVIGNLGIKIYKIYSIISFLIILLNYLRKGNISKSIIILFFFCFFPILSTFYNNSNMISSAIIQYIMIFGICILVQDGINTDPKILFKAIYIYGGIMCLIMAYTMFKYYPTGMDQGIYMDLLGDINYYFLGHDNASFFIVFPVIISGVYYSYLQYNKIKLNVWIFMAIMFLAYFYVWSATAMIVIVIFALLIIFKPKFINFRLLLIIFLLAFFGIVIFRLQDMFKFFIVDVLHKDLTISGRTYIWDKAVYYIKKSPLIGYGVEPFKISYVKFGISHVHNIILQIIYNGGFFGLVPYVLLVIESSKKILKSNSKYIYVIAISLFTYLICGLMDYYSTRYVIFSFYIIAANIDKIIDYSKNISNKKVAS